MTKRYIKHSGFTTIISSMVCLGRAGTTIKPPKSVSTSIGTGELRGIVSSTRAGTTIKPPKPVSTSTGTGELQGIVSSTRAGITIKPPKSVSTRAGTVYPNSKNPFSDVLLSMLSRFLSIATLDAGASTVWVALANGVFVIMKCIGSTGNSK